MTHLPTETQIPQSKAALLLSLAHLFPDVSDTEARLQALSAASPEGERWEHVHFRAAEEIYLPLWRALAPAYAATLASSFGGDSESLVTRINEWPATVADHQVALQSLLERSKLREGWRTYAHWFNEEFLSTNNAEQKKIAEVACRNSYVPLREIPLYQSSMRVACQQLVCLPLAQWEALHDSSTTYDPERIDPLIVDRLATRVAQVFNAPPLVDVDQLVDSGGWNEAVVWNTSSGNLTVPNSSHGMRDRWEHGWRGECTPLPADAVAPHWRYEGFFGRISVTLESGEDWVVELLAPLHFLRRLAYYPEWYRRMLP
jgi:hypothetical protein